MRIYSQCALRQLSCALLRVALIAVVLALPTCNGWLKVQLSWTVNHQISRESHRRIPECKRSYPSRFSSSRLASYHSIEHPKKDGDASSLRLHLQEGGDISSWLVCGDGDLSYSAAIASHLKLSKIKLTATVLEDEETHHAVYVNSRLNVGTILESTSSLNNRNDINTGIHSSTSSGHSVLFGVDATQLSSHFPAEKFDRIQFNFPHWRGKSNNKYNRRLLKDFFASAIQVLDSDDDSGGQILVALCQGQGGTRACTLQEWKQSWMIAAYAAEQGLILQSIEPYNPHDLYNLSSHRGKDRAFQVGDEPKLYRFGFPRKDSDGLLKEVETRLQLCCQHELHVVIDQDNGQEGEPSMNITSDFLQNLAQKTIAPKGITVQVIPVQENENVAVITSADMSRVRVAVFLVVYAGESIPLTRLMAQECCTKLEQVLLQMSVPLRSNRVGRMVSKPFPSNVLQSLVDSLK